jgi:hypothetical protein
MRWLGLAWALAAKQAAAAEKGMNSDELAHKHPSAAKADIDSMPFTARLKSCPFKALSFSAACKAVINPVDLSARVNSCPFKTLLAMTFSAACLALPAQADGGSVLKVDFSNPGLTPSKWTLVLHADGSAHFHADSRAITAAQLHVIEPTAVDRDVQLSQQFADRVFDTVHHQNLLNEACESHLKVAFQGWKKLTYSGPDGDGGCEFNYSKNKDIQSLGESLVGVASTIIEGARLELLLQHDPLGLDKEMEYLKEASDDGRLQQMCAIHGILTRLVDDPDVMERVRRRARLLLAEASK